MEMKGGTMRQAIAFRFDSISAPKFGQAYPLCRNWFFLITRGQNLRCQWQRELLYLNLLHLFNGCYMIRWQNRFPYMRNQNLHSRMQLVSADVRFSQNTLKKSSSRMFSNAFLAPKPTTPCFPFTGFCSISSSGGCLAVNASSIFASFSMIHSFGVFSAGAVRIIPCYTKNWRDYTRPARICRWIYGRSIEM